MTINSPKMRVQWRKLRRLRRRRHWLPGSQTCPKPFPNCASRILLPPPGGGSTPLYLARNANTRACTCLCRHHSKPSSAPLLSFLFVRHASRTTLMYHWRAHVTAVAVPWRAMAAYVTCYTHRRKSQHNVVVFVIDNIAIDHSRRRPGAVG